MTHTTEIALITANILAGGIGRSRSEKRFDAILELLAAHNAAAIAIQEALYWHEDDFALLHRAEQILGLRGVLAIEPRGMDIALFVGGPLALRSSRSITGTPWRHGAVHARAALPDGQILTLGSVHLSPRAPEQRLAEAQSISTWWDPDGLTVVMGDYNGADHDTDLSAVRPEIRARLALPGTATPDTRGPDHLAAVGFIDLAARATDSRAPTTGQRRDVETRCDRILTSPHAAQIASTTGLIDSGDLSDHDWLSTTLSVPPRPESSPLDVRTRRAPRSATPFGPGTGGNEAPQSPARPTGMINVIVPAKTWTTLDRRTRYAGALLIHGTIEAHDGSVNVLAGRLTPLVVKGAPDRSRSFR